MAVVKERIDILLMNLNVCESRNRAAAYILEGRVSIGGVVVKKPGEKFPVDSKIDFKDPEEEYVSRGAYKLLRAADKYGVSFQGLTCLDIGASTGGFTQLMLKRGAGRVICVDVGTGVLHPKIKNDPRVTSFEQTHINKFSLASAGCEFADVITCDVSFISVLKFIDKFDAFSRAGSLALILIKPQFEAEVAEVKKGGVVMDRVIHRRIIMNFIGEFAKKDFAFKGIVNTPKLKDCKNIEYLIFLKKHDKISDKEVPDLSSIENEVVALIDGAFLEFGR